MADSAAVNRSLGSSDSARVALACSLPVAVVARAPRILTELLCFADEAAGWTPDRMLQGSCCGS
jgi:hypothetical protein